MNGLKELGGQLVYDRPWHCSLCRRRFRARTLIEFWAFLPTAPVKRWAKVVIRLCRTDETAEGCAEMGLGALFDKERRQSKIVRRRLTLVGQKEAVG